MHISKKIKLFFHNLLNSWPKEQPEESECYLTVIGTDEFNIEIDFNFNIDSAAVLANILYQLDSGTLTGTIVEEISQQCTLVNKEEEFAAFMTALHDISMVNNQITDILVTEPVIKPSQVFKYTVEQPKLS